MNLQNRFGNLNFENLVKGVDCKTCGARIFTTNSGLELHNYWHDKQDKAIEGLVNNQTKIIKVLDIHMKTIEQLTKILDKATKLL